MPEIKQYNNQVEGLRPSERGIDATLQVARRAGAFYNQAADAVSTVGKEGARGYASAIKEAGDVAVMFAEHQEVSMGAPAFAGLTDALGRKWDDTVKADPNNPMLAQRFREDALEPEIDKFKASFNTEGGRKWAESHADALRNHLYTKTAADMGTLAANAVSVRMKETINGLSNAAMRDPSSTDFLLKSVDSSVSGMVDSSPNLRGVQAETARTKLSEAAKETIVKAGAIGAIQKAADPVATAEKWGEKYPQFINGAELKTLGKAAEVQQKNNRLVDKQLESYQKQQDVTRAHGAANKVMQDNVSIDPQTQRPIIKPDYFRQALEIAKMPNAPDGLARTLIDWGEHQQNVKDTNIRSDPTIKQDFVDRMFSTDKPTTEVELMRAQINGKLSKDDFTTMHHMVKTLEESPLKGPVWHDTMDAVKSELIVSLPGIPGKDTVGTSNYAKFAQSFIPEYIRQQRAGTLLPNALDVKDPKSMISEAMAPYKRSQSQRLSDYIALAGGLTLGGAGSTAPPVTLPAPDKREKNVTYPTARGPMKWTGTGWVAP